MQSNEKNPQKFPIFVPGIRANGNGPDGTSTPSREAMFNLGVQTAVNVVPYPEVSIRAKRG